MAKAKWHDHPGVRSGSELTTGERAADFMRNAMGSWCFVGLFMAVMAAWMVLNGVIMVKHWDPYPYILLNLILSTIAGLQGAILLIAAKRSDQISSELAKHDHLLLTRICERLGICDHPECQEES
jgi:uncharacterized membrane protein